MRLAKQRLLTALPVTVLLFAGGLLLASAQPFTYQGRLLDSALPAVGNYDFTFQLFDSPTNGNVLGNAITNSLAVSNSLFTAQLDFGDNLWLSETTWLQISVRPSVSALDFTLLAPLQEIAAVIIRCCLGRIPRQSPLVGVVGDPFSQDSACTSWPSCLMSLFDNLDVWASAVGSTGYLNPGTPGRTNFQSRITSDVTFFNPEYVLFAGGINDASLMSNQVAQATLQQVCLGCYQLIQSNVPGCKVMALGPFWPRTPIDPAAYMVNGAISNACQLAGISGCYIDTLSDPWVTGQWNIPGSGNAVVYTSSDGTHPTSSGAWNIAAHVAAELSSRFPELLVHR